MSWLDLAKAVPYLAAGLALGATYFLLLLRVVRLHATQAASTRTVPLHLVRVAGAVAVFWVIAQQGALPLLSALLGFLIARVMVQRWAGSE